MPIHFCKSVKVGDVVYPAGSPQSAGMIIRLDGAYKGRNFRGTAVIKKANGTTQEYDVQYLCDFDALIAERAQYLKRLEMMREQIAPPSAHRKAELVAEGKIK